MVSNASEDLPEPLKPVMTTSLSRGMESVRFLRLCSRAPPILMNSLAIKLRMLRPNQSITVLEEGPKANRLRNRVGRKAHLDKVKKDGPPLPSPLLLRREE